MDNPADFGSALNERRWAPRVEAVIVAWLIAVGALLWCVFGSVDAAGRLLAGVMALVVGVAALFGTRARPRLAADALGLRIRGLLQAHDYPWRQVRGIRLVSTRRFGRDVPTLEVEVTADADERLWVFGWLELGTDPRDVADTLQVLRPS